MSFILIILVLQAVQGLVLGGFLICTNRGRKVSNFYLAGFLFTLIIEVCYALVSIKTNINLDFLAFFGFLYGPFLLLYIESLHHLQNKRSLSPLLHIPMLVFILPSLFYGTSSRMFEAMLTLCFLYYFVLAFLQFERTRRLLEANYSNLDIVDIKWLYGFLFPFFPLIAIDILEFVYGAMRFERNSMILLHIQAILFLFIINYLTIAGWMKVNSFMGNYENIEGLTLSNTIKSTSYRDEYTKGQLSGYANSIVTKIKTEELFKNPEMDIQTLAESVGISPRLVSHTINLYFGTNFSDFVNSHRLEYAKELLIATSNEEKNISQILYASGFNSTTSFYTYFKKREGIAPKEFRKANSKPKNRE